MLQSVFRALRASAENLVRAWDDAEEVWDVSDPFLDASTPTARAPLGIYE